MEIKLQNSSEKLSQAKTSLKFDNSCFENIVRSISFRPHKAVGPLFGKNFFILV